MHLKDTEIPTVYGMNVCSGNFEACVHMHSVTAVSVNISRMIS